MNIWPAGRRCVASCFPEMSSRQFRQPSEALNSEALREGLPSE